MKRIILFIITTALLLITQINAQNKGFGIGIIVGEPTGVSLKYWTSSSTAFDGAVAWSFIDNGALHLHADYLIHNFTLITVSTGKLPFYYGIGARIKLVDKTRLGVRVPVGLAYLMNGTPIDFFLEIVPILDLAPKTDFKINAAIGARYYLN